VIAADCVIAPPVSSRNLAVFAVSMAEESFVSNRSLFSGFRPATE